MLSRYSVKRPYTVLVGVILVLVLGFVSYTHMQTDLLPDMTLPYAIVYTTYPGASPEEVESGVTRPVEQAMATISNIENINSISSENISMVILEFAQTANMDAVTIEMRESLDQIEGYFDDSVGSPVIMKLNPDMMPVMVAAVEAGDKTQAELTDYVNDKILPELESVEGVASVTASGTVEEQVEVILREEKINQVNEKIRRVLEGQFASAENELSAAKEQITAGKQQIAQAREAMAAASGSMTGEMDPAAMEGMAGTSDTGAVPAVGPAMSMGAPADLETQEEELSAKESEIDSAMAGLKEQKDAALAGADLQSILTMDMVKGLLTAQNFAMPAGYITEEGIDYLIRVGDKFSDTEELENLELLDMNLEGLEPIRLSDVADVAVRSNDSDIYARINGEAGILFSMQKQSGYSTGDVTERLKKRFASLEKRDENLHFVELMDQGVYIDLVVDSVLQNILFGAALAILILLLFLKDIRPTLVIACSIPISILVAIVLMYFSGIDLNIISLSGLALGVGMLVDNSIVVIENIYRMRGEGVSVKKAAVEGARQVAGAIAASTLTTICVFLPIVFTEGITRQLFVDMGLTIAYSLLASLLVALTLVPAMGAGMLRNVKEKRSPFFTRVQNFYGKILGGALKIKPLVLLGALGILVLSVYLSVSKGTQFMPEMESTQMTASVILPEDATPEEVSEMTDLVMSRIQEVPDVTDVGAMNGGSGMMSMGQSAGNETSVYILLNEKKDQSNDEIAKAIEEKTEDLPCEVTVESSGMDMSALGGSGISVKIKGRDLDMLRDAAGDIAALLENVEGTAEVSDGIEEKTKELRLVVNKDKAITYQLTTAQIYMELQGRLAAARSTTTLATDTKDYSVLVLNEENTKLTREEIKNLSVTGKNQEGEDVEVPLKELVSFEETESFSSIRREAQTRYVTVTAGIAEGYNIGLVSNEVQKKLDEYQVPEGITVEMAGEDETINEAMTEVIKMLALALVFMYLIMVAQFQSLLSPFIIMFTIPLAFTGGFLGLYLTDSPVSVIAMIGFVMLSGIIVNNGIVLVDYINQLRRCGMEKRAAIVEAGRTRLRPVLMTALTTILGLTTMAMGMGMGASMVQPMAIVTIGGLLYGTLLTLFVVPCIYDLLNRKKDMTEEEI